MINVILVADDILRTPGSDAPHDTGTGLYHALATTTRLFLLTENNPDDLATWLHRARLNHHIALLHTPGPGPTNRLDTLERLRTWRQTLVIEPDPHCAAAELAAGWHVLLHTRAAYPSPAWRPDREPTPRPWDALTREIEHQRALRDKDPRNQPPPDDTTPDDTTHPGAD